MSESVAPLRAPRTPDKEKRGLPLAPELKERWLRPRKGGKSSSPGAVLGWTFGLVGIIALIALGAPTFVWVLSFSALASGAIGWVMRSARRFNVRCAEAIQLLHSGDAAGAERIFDELARKGSTAQLAGVAQYNLALTALQRGDLERALSLLQAAWLGAGLKTTQPVLQQTLPFLVAMVYAALGDVGAAHAWNEQGKRDRKLAHLCHDIVVDALMSARQHAWQEARERIESRWLEVEALYSATLARSLRVIRALVVHHAGDAERARALVEGAKPFLPGEYAWLGASWPEMQAFLAEHKLA